MTNPRLMYHYQIVLESRGLVHEWRANKAGKLLQIEKVSEVIFCGEQKMKSKALNKSMETDRRYSHFTLLHRVLGSW